MPVRMHIIGVIALATAGIASAQGTGEIAVPEAPGVRIFLEPGTGGSPEQQVAAARRSLEATHGASMDNSAPVLSGDDTRFAVLTGRFRGDSHMLHGWIAADSSQSICHLTLPANEQAVQAMRPGIMRCMQALLQGGAAAGSTNRNIAADQRAATPAATISPADLAGALGAVPQAHRPVSIVMRSAMSFNGMMAMPTFEPWMLFANGWSTDCTDWDPAMVAPEPAALQPYGCTMLRWRRSGASYEFETDPGEWEGASPSNLTPFASGERIEVDLVNQSGFGTPIGSPGLAVSSLSSGQLRMTSGGQIAVGSWTSVVVSGDNVGGGSSNVRGPAVGNYHLDGHLIAVADGQGLRRGFIARDNGTGGPYIYLNGDLFWPKRQ